MKPIAAFTRLVVFLTASIVCALPYAAAAEETATDAEASTQRKRRVICDRVVEDFSGVPIGQFPSGWRTRHDHNLEKAKSWYRVREADGRRALHAVYGSNTITLVKALDDWDVDTYPYLQWRWKAVTLPKGGNEKHSDTNDSTASVYVVWKTTWPFRAYTMRFAWSTTLPKGTHVSKRLGHDHVLIAETGRKHVGHWRTVRINVREAFRRFVDKTVKNPAGLALTTDADDTGSSAEAYYADFRLCRIEAP